MSNWHRGGEQVSLLTLLISQVKRFLIIIYLLAVLFSALVVPFIRESIITTVRNWLSMAG
jgi:hypothetical protein